MIRKARALVGHMARDNAVQVIQGGAAVQPGTDISGPLSVWELARMQVAARPVVQIEDPTLALPNAYAPRATEFMQRPEVQQAFAPHDWSVVAINLSMPILSYQNLVYTDDAVQRVSGVDLEDPDALFDACLPQAEKVELPGGFDPSQNAFTISSLNPNLRIASFEVVETPVPPSLTKRIIGFTLSLGSSHIQITEYRGRWMIRDGYHRLFGLMARGAKIVPCVLIKARSLDETGAGRPGFFGFEVLYSDRPPLLSDFLDDKYSVEVTTPAVRKVVRIRGEEFVVPV
jgi:hypothetical protein